MKRPKPFIEFHEDFEREHLKDFVYLQADREEEQRIMQEIMEEENRLPASITVVYEIKERDESKTDTLPF